MRFKSLQIYISPRGEYFVGIYYAIAVRNNREYKSICYMVLMCGGNANKCRKLEDV